LGQEHPFSARCLKKAPSGSRTLFSTEKGKGKGGGKQRLSNVPYYHGVRKREDPRAEEKGKKPPFSFKERKSCLSKRKKKEEKKGGSSQIHL